MLAVLGFFYIKQKNFQFLLLCNICVGHKDTERKQNVMKVKARRAVTQHLYLPSCLGDFLVLFWFSSQCSFLFPLGLRYQTEVANMFDQI